MSDEFEIIYQSVIDDYSEEIRLSQAGRGLSKERILFHLTGECLLRSLQWDMKIDVKNTRERFKTELGWENEKIGGMRLR